MAIVSNNPTANDPASCITAVWDALQHWRSLALEPNDPTDDEDWNKITEAMAWITEQLDCEVDSNGDTVHVEPDRKIVQCKNCGGTNVETKAWVKYEKGQFVISTYCEEGWTCWECEIENVDVTEEDA